MTEFADPLAAFVAQALGQPLDGPLDRPAPPEIAGLARQIAARPGVVAVLFYGNMLRAPQAGGLADLYALTDSDRAWRGAGPGAVANRLLPPNVYHIAIPSGPPAVISAPPVIPAKAGIHAAMPGDPRLRGDDTGQSAGDPRLRGDDGRAADDPVAAVAGAKVAVMRLAAFRHRMRRDGWDTTVWARFAQPAALLYARDEAARAAVVEAIATGWRTAAHWADRLADGPDRWAGLFAATYAAELRPEGARRPSAIAGAAPDLYAGVDRLLPPESVSEVEKRAARRAWRHRCRAGRALNALRLVKAASTFRGGAAYALAKIERHAGPDALSPWEKRLPWLAAPGVLLRLLRRGGHR